jgi:Ca-activated chloride channel family protein
VAAGILLAWAPAAHAQGMIIEPDVIAPWNPEPWQTQPITLQSESIEVDLNDQIAHVKTTQVFKNNTWMDLEGIYVFPLPKNADISDFALWMDGRELTAETLPAEQASQIYQQIVSSMRDPGLLEYMGSGMIRAHIYPIPANGTKQVDIEYDWLLPIESDLMRVALPLKLDGYSIDKIENLAITVNIESPDPLGTIFSPTHDIKIDHDGARSATVSFEKGSHRPTGDFVLYISRPQGAVGLNLLSHATGDDEGYFLAMIAPEYNEERIQVVPKDFVCVLDTSGSMAGNKIEQAKSALDFIFQNLNSDDRFNLITFATDVYPYFNGWRDATSSNIADVREFIDGIDAGGSTNIDGAMAEALSLDPSRERPMYVVFLTDGLPTVGEQNTAVIIDNVSGENQDPDARIFCFGVGDDVDYVFIDQLSRENGGYTASVSPYEDLEQPLSDFYEKIKSPVMTDLDVEIDGTRIYDFVPAELPDLFLGSQLVVAGRYNGTGDLTIQLSGMVGDRDVSYTYHGKFSDDDRNEFIPRHWATRRVGYLLNQIRLYGENQELVDEIVQLARRYGIITPYTSMLVTEDEMVPPMVMEEMRSMGGAFDMSGAAPAPGAQRAESMALNDMERGGTGELNEGLKDVIKYAGDKTFYLNEEGFYEDSEFADSGLEPVHVTYLSDEYFDLVADHPDLAEYFSVGEKVIVVFEDVAYRVEPEED